LLSGIDNISPAAILENFEMSDCMAPYPDLLERARASPVFVRDVLRAELPGIFLDAYLAFTQRPTNVVVITSGTFDYVYDNYAELEAMSAVEPDAVTESRLVGAVGFSAPHARRRQHDDGRLRGWVGPTGATFGAGWDKGHFIGHCIGGAVDGLEMNVFLQRRSVNRGGYRRLERYATVRPGTLCFSRPIYDGPSACPVAVEFGVLTVEGTLSVELFDNRPGPSVGHESA
jgi:hypothetical protein